MKTGKVKKTPTKHDHYRRLSLVELISRIVEHSDALALKELHDHRRPCRTGNTRPLRITEYVRHLSESRRPRDLCAGDPVVLDEATGLTLDKFSALPHPSSHHRKSEGSKCHRTGIDCRRYFKAYLQHVAQNDAGQPDAGTLAREASAALFLQRFVVRHFRLSRLECKRQAPEPVRRYYWRIRGVTLLLFFPTAMSSRECRNWLDAHVDSAGGALPMRRAEVQAIIDERLLLTRVYSLDGFEDIVGDCGFSGSITRNEKTEGGSVVGLADVVAAEKAQNIGRQRPTIRALGKVALAGLIRRIFEDLSLGQYDQGKVAAAFSLTKATLSRFAGADWNKRTASESKDAIPDLWHNTAETLASRCDLVERGIAFAALAW